jgi:hypothetical protein
MRPIASRNINRPHDLRRNRRRELLCKCRYGRCCLPVRNAQPLCWFSAARNRRPDPLMRFSGTSTGLTQPIGAIAPIDAEQSRKLDCKPPSVEQSSELPRPNCHWSCVAPALPGRRRTVSKRILTKLFTVAAGSESFFPMTYNSNWFLHSCKTLKLMPEVRSWRRISANKKMPRPALTILIKVSKVFPIGRTLGSNPPSSWQTVRSRYS